VRGKGDRQHRFPIPHDVGTALVAYLRRGRPRCRSPRVFVRCRAPYRGFKYPSQAVNSVVSAALDRAGLVPRRRGAHLLRRTAATQMLRRGASLDELVEVLRHRGLKTLPLYAKVDLNALRRVAQPWPGSAQ
jgi:site-specific recombinase XerD